MDRALFLETTDLANQKVVLGFSGGPDAAALACKLKNLGAYVIPVYINYRKVSGGGKTAKDLRSAIKAARSLGIPDPLQIRRPLGKRPKNQRNRFFVKVLASLAKQHDARVVAIGTIRRDNGDERNRLGRAITNDLSPEVLRRHGRVVGVTVVTWDSFNVRNKADEFIGMDPETRDALFQTTSCQMWWRLECGNCHSCVSRHAAFVEAFGFDLTSYRPRSRVMR